MTLKTITFLCLLILLKPTLSFGQSSYIGTEIFGKASYYENWFYGRKTANGEILKKNLFTCAHQTLPFGTMIEVTNLTNNNSCIVRVNDRGPYMKKRIIDLSQVAAQQLNMLHPGVVNVKLTIVGENNKIYIASPGSMDKTATEIVNEPGEKHVQVPLKPKNKAVRSRSSKAAKAKRAVRRGVNNTPPNDPGKQQK